MLTLGEWAAIAQIATAIATAAASAKYVLSGWRQRLRLETYLKSVKQAALQKNDGTDSGSRSIVHLMSNVGLTEEQILDAAFRSKHIKRLTRKDHHTGLATELLFTYTGLQDGLAVSAEGV